MSARPRLLAPVVAVLAVVFLLGGTAVSLYTELLWFRETGFTRVFTTTLQTRILLFVAFGILMAVGVGANLVVAYRVRPAFRPMSLEQQNLERYRTAVEPYLLPVLLLATGVLGLFAGLSAASRWQTWLLWRNATPFGQTDRQFNRDISYYAMTYPFQRFLLGFLFAVVILALIASALTHYLFGGVRLQTPGDKVSPAARAHLSVLAGLLVLLKAVAYYLDRFGLAFSLRGRVQGASYTDVNAVLPAKNVLAAVAVICALLFFANIVFRNFLVPAFALVLLVLTAVVAGGIYPAYTQQFRVKPNEIRLEAPYIARNIEATRKAYSIDGVQMTTYDAKPTSSQAQLRADQGTITKTRLLDPNVVSPTFTQFQRLRAYFGFPASLDIDRYNLGAGEQDYVVALRELHTEALSADQRNWINEHLIYTHGNGFVAAPANQTDNGRPVFTVGNLPVTGPLKIDESRVYYGEGTSDYSIVNTRQQETDGPIGGSDAPTYSYQGSGGISLSGLTAKLAYALKFREKNILLSNALTPSSRLMYIRTPRERVQQVAPFLQLDEDPYPAVVDGKVLWIVDGYTTSAGYPYSERTVLGQVTQDSQTVNGSRLAPEEVNYIRNSVKATVDAFTGKVTLYRFDAKQPDPLLETWNKAFGGILQPESAISPDLRSHLRYPEDLFKVQRDLLTKYHVTEPGQFFQGNDYWQIPADPAGASLAPATDAGQPGAAPGPASKDQPPYYVLSRFPGAPRTAFNLTTSFVARRSPNLTAVAAVSSDPGDYGTIRVLQLPDNVVINGPGQVAGQFQSTPAIREQLSLLDRGNSKVIPGNLLTLPVGGGLLYIEPVYVQAQQGESYPLLQFVAAVFGDKVAFQPTLARALDQLFGAGTAPSPSPSGSPSAPGSPRPAPGGGSAVQQLIDAAQKAFADGQQALRASDFAAYGAAQKRLQTALEQLAAASARTPPASGSPAPAPPAPAASSPASAAAPVTAPRPSPSPGR